MDVKKDEFGVRFGSMLGPFWDPVAPFGLQKGSARSVSKRIGSKTSFGALVGSLV